MTEQSWDSLKEAEKKKALRRYGEQGQEPGGHPDYDVFDFCIHELVGLLRYKEMLEYRTEVLYTTGQISGRELREMGNVLFNMQLSAQQTGTLLLNMRNQWLQRGIKLGRTEEDVTGGR